MSRSCPRCGKSVDILGSTDGGQSVTCPSCGAVLRLGDQSDETTESAAADEGGSLDSLELDDILSDEAQIEPDELSLSPIDDADADDDLPKLHQPDDELPSTDFSSDPPATPKGPPSEESLHEEAASLLDEVEGADIVGAVGAGATILTGDDDGDAELPASGTDGDVEEASLEIDFVAESADESLAELIADEDVLDGSALEAQRLEETASDLATPSDEIDEFVFEPVDEEPLLLDPEPEVAPPEAFDFHPADEPAQPSFDDIVDEPAADESTVVGDVAGGLAAAAAGAAGAAFAASDNDSESAAAEQEMTLEPVDPAVADLPPAGTTAREAAKQKKSRGLFRKSKDKMTVAPTVPKKRNIVADIVKVGAGAIVGLSIAQLVLWWAFKSDPLGIAQRMPAMLAIAVPEELRSSLPPVRAPLPPDYVADDEALAAADAADRDSAFPADDAQPQPSDVAADDPTAEPTDDQMAAAGSDTRTAEVPASDDVVFDEPDSEADMPADDLLADDMSETEVDDLDDLLDDQLPAETSATSSPYDGFGPRDATAVKPYDLAAALSAARAAHASSGAVLNPDTKRANAALFDYYIALAKLADSAVRAEWPATIQVLNDVRGLMGDVASHPKKLRQLRGAAASWFKHAAWQKQDVGRGAVVTGIVSDTNRIGELTEVDVRVTKSRTVTLVVKGSAPNVGSHIVALGLVVDEPSSNLLKYEGFSDRVVWTTDLIVPGP